MPQVTALSPLGTPGVPYTFTAKAVAVVVVWTFKGVAELFTAANWGTGSTYFQVHMKAIIGTYRARLYNVTDSSAVVGSEVNTVATSYTRVRSGAITLTDGKEYRGQVGSVAGDSGDQLGAKWITF